MLLRRRFFDKVGGAALSFLLFTPAARADEPAPAGPPPAAPSGTPRLGGLGWAFVGGWFGLLRGLEGALQAPDALGPDTSITATSLQFGGGGGLLVAHRLWIGGKGFGVLHRLTGEARGRGSLRAGGGGFEVGAALVNDGRSLVIPFLGVGGLGYNLDLEAPAGGSLARGGAPLVASGEATLKAGLLTAELGARFQRLIFWGSRGMTVGVEVGLLTSLNSPRWKQDGQEQAALPQARFTGGLVRFNVGGGGFLFR